MKKTDFALLLTDLYTAYNPDYIQYVNDLVEKYSGMEFSAIDMALLKYNRKTASFYDPQKDTDEYRLFLIKEYSKGNRPLSEFKAIEDNSKVETKLAQESKKIEETIESIKTEFSSTEKELLQAYEAKIQELNKKISEINEPKNNILDAVDVKIILNYTEHELKLPNKDFILALGVGARIITTTKDGKKIIGLKIIDIMYDGISDFTGKPIIEIIINKE